MKYLISVFTFLIILGCKQKVKENSDSSNFEPIKKIEIVSEKQQNDEINKLDEIKESKIERWFEPNDLDTILLFKNSHSLKLKNTDSIFISEYFLGNEILDSLTKFHNNSHRKALDIENYLLKSNNQFAKKDSLGLHLKMKDGEWKLISVNFNKEEADNTFEHYFQEFGFYSVRTQWSEGNGYKLINDTVGEVYNLFGRPYFSENGQYVISVNVDIEAGYSSNGFQLFQNINGKLTNLGVFEPDGWGPYSAKWIDNSTVILKNETVEFKDGKMNYIDFYSELKINNGG